LNTGLIIDKKTRDGIGAGIAVAGITILSEFTIEISQAVKETDIFRIMHYQGH